MGDLENVRPLVTTRRTFIGGVAAVSAAVAGNPTGALAETVSSQQVRVGDTVALGTYAEDPIEWKILKVEGGKALAISMRVVTGRPLFDAYVEQSTWAASSLRAWLNGEFLEGFTSDELSRIQAVRLENPGNEEYGTPGGPDTVDRVFLLSVDEAREAMTPEDFDDLVWGEQAAADFESWACGEGALFGVDANYYSAASLLGSPAWFLTRTPGETSYKSCVFSAGEVYGSAHVYHGHGIRPALWLSLDEPAAATVTFGSYPQGEDGEVAPIEWLVLEEQEGRKLLLSRRCLCATPFSEAYAGTTWAGSTLRAWLNGEFLSDAFTDEEMSRIESVEVSNPGDQGRGTEDEETTVDKIFVLGLEDAAAYLGAPADVDDDLPHNLAIASATGHAVRQGVWRSSETGGSAWWLRSQGDKPNYRSIVRSDGRTTTECDDANCYIGVRPALWANL